MQNPVPEPMLARIGDIVVSFTMLEHMVQILVARLLGDDLRVAQVVNVELPFPRLRAVAINLYRERHPDDEAGLEELQGLMARASEVEGERNLIVHSVWTKHRVSGTIARAKVTARIKRGLNVEFVEPTVDDLDGLTQQIQAVALDVRRFTVTHYGR